MPQFHLGAFAAGGFDLGALAFIAFVLAQLLAMIWLRRFETDAKGAQAAPPSKTNPDPDRIAAPIQPALQS